MAPRSLVFGDLRFDLAMRELARVEPDGATVPLPLGSRAADILLVFLQRPGDLVTKSEIMTAVWPNTVVEDSNLTVQVSALRRVLDAGREGSSVISTVPGRGYRFTLPVRAGGTTEPTLTPAATQDVAPDARIATTATSAEAAAGEAGTTPPPVRGPARA